MYLQTDARWANEIVGFGGARDTFKRVGCTVTALTELINRTHGTDYKPNQVNDLLKSKKAFLGALLVWSRVPLAFPKLAWYFRDYNYNNAVVAAWIYVYPRLPVMVEVKTALSPTGKHWVLYIGGRQLFDPLYGLRSTSYYPIATGSARYKLA